MAEESKNENSSSQNLSEVEFETADKRSDDDENNENRQLESNKMIFGEDLVQILGDAENRNIVLNEEMAQQLQIIIGDNEQLPDSDASQELSEEVQTNIDVMYSIKARENEPGEHDVRVLKMSQFFLPDTEKRRK